MLARPLRSDPRPRALMRWLALVAALVFATVLVGGITRLTESGLSIVEWKPVRGVIPPLNAAQWRAEFDAYKAIPQYRAFNTSMTLTGFQHIYFWEYLHRLLARAIGTVLGIVALVYWWRRRIPAGYGRRIVALLLLGGLQGAIGWWMVASGLQYRTEVSHIRLAAHLLGALLIFAALVWTVLDLRRLAARPGARAARLPWLGGAALAALALQLMLGAFTSGLRAGYAYAEWPTMGGALFPEGVAFLRPAWRNLIDQPIVVQFVHRWWAWVVAALVLALAARGVARGSRGAPAALLVTVAAQIALGIATLLSGVRIEIAVAHQACAVLLLAALLATAHGIGAREAGR